MKELDYGNKMERLRLGLDYVHKDRRGLSPETNKHVIVTISNHGYSKMRLSPSSSLDTKSECSSLEAMASIFGRKTV